MPNLTQKEKKFLTNVIPIIAIIPFLVFLISAFKNGDFFIMQISVFICVGIVDFIFLCVGLKIGYRYITDKDYKKNFEPISFFLSVNNVISFSIIILSGFYQEYIIARQIFYIALFLLFLPYFAIPIYYTLNYKYERLFIKSLILYSSFCILILYLDKINISQNIINTANKILFIVPFILMVISSIFWFFVGRDKKNMEIIEVSSPNNINPLLTSYFFHQDLIIPDIAPQLFNFQERGYITVNDRLIEKIKDYDGEDENEKKFLETLFYKTQGKLLFTKLDENRKRIEKIINIIKNNLTKTYTTRVSRTLENICEDFILVSWFCIFMFLYFNILANNELSYVNIFISLLFFIPVVIFTVYERTINLIVKRRSYFKYSYFACNLVIFILLILIFGGLTFIKSIPVGFWILTVQAFVLIAVTFITRIFQLNLVQWNEKGWDMVNRVLGYKKYLEKVEFDKILGIGSYALKDFIKTVPYMYIFEYKSRLFKREKTKKDEETKDLMKSITPHIKAIFSAIKKIRNSNNII